MNGLVMVAILAIYAGLPLVCQLLGLGDPILLAMELMALVMLLLATRLVIMLAGSALLVMTPVALIAGVLAAWAVVEVGLRDEAAQLLRAGIGIGFSAGLLGLFYVLTRAWRHGAMAGLSLAVGALSLALLTPWLDLFPLTPAVRTPSWIVLVPAGLALFMALTIQFWIDRSAALAALSTARHNPLWASVMGIPTARLSGHLLIVAGVLAGLAALPLADSQIIDSPERWPGLWFGVMAATILSGRNGPGDVLVMALPLWVLPRLLLEWQPDLPDLTLACACLGLLVATLSHRGRRPGDAALAMPNGGA